MAVTKHKPAAQVLADALNYFMSPFWNNVTLSKAAGVSEGTIRNYRKDAATSGASGKVRSAKLAELEAIATAMGLHVADLLQDLTPAERATLYRQRAAEHYQRTGTLPPWAPTADSTLPTDDAKVAERASSKQARRAA